jgi:hypothetical protein
MVVNNIIIQGEQKKEEKAKKDDGRAKKGIAAYESDS